jgi:hypothetical protein
MRGWDPLLTVLKAEIDTDIDPIIPFIGAKIKTNIKSGKVAIERRYGDLWVGGKKVIPHLSPCQKNGVCVKGDVLYKELVGRPVLSACILDFLLDHTDFIPESWEGKGLGSSRYIWFWGTMYCDFADRLCVRCLYRGSVGWSTTYLWAGLVWGDIGPAALLVG